MSMELMTFQNEEFGEIRTAEIGGEPWFCLADICRPLGLRPSACKSRLKEDGVIITDGVDSLGRANELNFVNEANLYRVIFQSRKPEAERFVDYSDMANARLVLRHSLDADLVLESGRDGFRIVNGDFSG